MALNILAIGGSRGVGYWITLRFLNEGATVTFLLRSPSIFDQDEAMQKHIADKRAILFKGDALNREDVRRAWGEAAKAHPDASGSVDYLIFSIGGRPSGFSLRNGPIFTPPDLGTKCMLNVLCTLPKSQPQPPRLIAITTQGLGEEGHAILPAVLRPLYGYFLYLPHLDKAGTERCMFHAAGWDWTIDEPSSEIMGEGWRDEPELPAPGSFQEVLIVRPALFTNAEPQGDMTTLTGPPYRVSEPYLSSSWTISRKDVAHFIVEKASKNWSEWRNKAVDIAY